MVKIKTLDGAVFDIDPVLSKLSGLLLTILHVDPHDSDGVIEVSVKSASTMAMIVSYMKHYSVSPGFSKLCKPLYTPDLRLAGANEFDLALVGHASFDEVKALLVASDYLDIPSLTELCCAKLASVIKTIPLRHMLAQTSQAECD